MSSLNNTPLARNTPKGIQGNTDVSQIPGGYRIVKMNIRNSNGQVKDMQSLVIAFTLTEELFSPVVVFNAKIHDTINFFEDFALSGQEIIDLEMVKIDAEIGSKSVIKSSFIVKEYPNYEKAVTSPNAQDYNLIAVSDFAYLSMLKRISKSVKGNPVHNIVNIFNKELNVKKIKSTSDCVTSFDGIINIQSPLKAVEWLREKAFDAKGAPFFLYNNILTNEVQLNSWTSIVKGSVYNTYKYHQFLKNSALTTESYSEAMSKIINMKSNIKLDKLRQATEGGFASKTEITDYANKTFVQKIFNLGTDTVVNNNRLDTKTSYGKAMQFLVNGITSKKQDLTTSPDASRSLLSTNSAANSSGAPNAASGPILDNMSRAKSYIANMQSMNHEIQVYGDFRLNPGKKIKIEIPKSSNAKIYNEEIKFGNKEELDLSLSGTYIVTIAVHSFKDGLYTSRLKIIKDFA